MYILFLSAIILFLLSSMVFCCLWGCIFYAASRADCQLASMEEQQEKLQQERKKETEAGEAAAGAACSAQWAALNLFAPFIDLAWSRNENSARTFLNVSRANCLTLEDPTAFRVLFGNPLMLH